MKALPFRQSSSEKRRSHETNGRYVRSDADRLGSEVSRSATPCARRRPGRSHRADRQHLSDAPDRDDPPGRPIGNFLFLGPTGSGKTRIVEATAEALLKNPRAVIKIDCAEFQHSHEIAKLIGSPPGYLGHRETHPLLVQEVLNQYHTETHETELRAVRRDRKGHATPCGTCCSASWTKPR